MSRSLDTKSTSIAVPDRGSFATGHQQCYLSPPLTPYPHFHSSHDSLDSISPVLAPYHTPLPSLQEMLPHDGRQRRSARDLGRYNSPSASRHHPRRESKEILESSTSAIYTGGQVANDPARLLPMYPTENHVTIPPPATIVSPMLRRNKAHVASACVNCKKAHLACEAARPCRRCVSLDKQDTCVDVQHKRRGRPRLKDLTPSTTTGASEPRRGSYHNRRVSDESGKAQSGAAVPYPRENPRRESHHHRSTSQGSQAVGPRHHPYASPTTAPTSGYAGRDRGTNSGYFDTAPPSRNPGSLSQAYPHPRGPNSPTYYPYVPAQPPTPQQNESMVSPVSSYHPSPSGRPERQYSGPVTQPLLPFPDATPPGLMRRGSFPSIIHQSEQGHSPQRVPIHRTGSGPPTEYPGRNQQRDQDPNDLVKLPSLKDLGVPFR